MLRSDKRPRREATNQGRGLCLPRSENRGNRNLLPTARVRCLTVTAVGVLAHHPRDDQMVSTRPKQSTLRSSPVAENGQGRRIVRICWAEVRPRELTPRARHPLRDLGIPPELGTASRHPGAPANSNG